MTPEQIKSLWAAANQAGLTAEQINNLQPINPYTQTGAVARMMQSAIARVDPAVAQQFLAEAGTTMSLKAQAAQLGLTERTPAIDAEIAAFTPRTPEQAKAERIEELIAANPYPTQGVYLADGSYQPGKGGNLTAALELEALAPERAAALKMAAQPPKPQAGALSSEGAAFVNAGLASANAAQRIY
jgi:hypothetical protein